MKYLYLLFLISSTVFARPQKLSIWFVSPDYTSFIPQDGPIFSSKFAQDTSKFECTPMGDGCFHPQLGFFEKEGMKKDIKETAGEIKKDRKEGSFADRNVQLVDCKKGNFFDIYCGKSNKERLNDSRYQVWVDVSSSLKHSDRLDVGENCYRRLFVENLKNTCSKRDLDVYLYNTSKWQMGAYSGLCLSKGTNSEDNLVRWIEQSTAKRLLIITDIDERSVKISNLITELGAEVRGVGATALKLKDISTYGADACSFFKN